MTQQKLLTLSELDEIEKGLKNLEGKVANRHQATLLGLIETLIHGYRESIKVAQFYGDPQNWNSDYTSGYNDLVIFGPPDLGPASDYCKQRNGAFARSFLNKIGVE